MAALYDLKGWRLFGVLAVLTTAVPAIGLLFLDPGSLEDSFVLTSLANRGAVPGLVLSFAASSLVYLRPGKFSRWLMQNRKYFGLSFALGMFWQLMMIVHLMTRFPDYFFKAFPLTPLGMIPWAVFALIGAMTLTSFKRFQRMIGGKAWRYMHKTGMYLFWAIFTGAYLGKALATPLAFTLPRVAFALTALALIGAWVLRIEAWTAKRRKRRGSSATITA